MQHLHLHITPKMEYMNFYLINKIKDGTKGITVNSFYVISQSRKDKRRHKNANSGNFLNFKPPLQISGMVVS